MLKTNILMIKRLLSSVIIFMEYVIVMSEDLNEFNIMKKGDLYILLKEFTDIVLFKGDNVGLKNYFKSLFDSDIYEENVINKRFSQFIVFYVFLVLLLVLYI